MTPTPVKQPARNLAAPSAAIQLDASAPAGGLLLRGSVEIDLTAAAAGEGAKVPRVTGRANDGGPMKVAGWSDPVIIDLAGVTTHDQTGIVPLLRDHDQVAVVGHAQVKITPAGIDIQGFISGTGQAAQDVTGTAKNGFPWGLSVGCRPTEIEYVGPTKKVQVNGRQYDGPLNVARRSELYEISFVAVAAGSGTSARIAAKAPTNSRKERKMDGFMKWMEKHEIDPETLSPEKETEFRATYDAEIDAKLAALRASQPKGPAIHAGGGGPELRPRDMLAVAALHLFGFDRVAEKSYRPEVLDGGAGLRVNSPLGLIEAALRLANRPIPRSPMDIVASGFSTTDLGNVLGDTINKVLLPAYADTPRTFDGFAAVRNVKDFHTAKIIRPSNVLSLKQVAPDGDIEHGQAKEWTSSFSVGTFARMLAWSRQDAINDNAGFFNDIAPQMAVAARRAQADNVLGTVLANAGSFFSAGNGNYFDGAGSALSITSLATAVQKMRSQRSAENDDLDIVPAVLVVPPELEVTARALLASEFIAREADEPTGNALRQIAGLAVEPRLSNTAKFAGASTTAWYLFAGPTAAPVVVAYLNGQQTPTVEFFGLDSQADRLALTWRVYFDYGSALCDPKAAVKSKGAA